MLEILNKKLNNLLPPLGYSPLAVGELFEEPLTLREQLDIQPMETVDPASYPKPVMDYFHHYELDWADLAATHWFGTFESGGFTLAAHLYEPREYTATVVLLHGYLNHSGQFRNLIRFLLENGFAVALFDLPGHGLSSGERAAIDSFDQYIKVTGDFIQLVKSRLHGPYMGIGFSTGAAILIEMLLTEKADDFDKIVLAAPLIHWTGYEQSKGTYKVYKVFTNKIARFYRRNSSDKNYLIFNKTQDYLHCTHIDLSWVKALFDWNDKLETLSNKSDWEVLVLQGDKDGTVDWKYNMDLVRHKFPNAQIIMIPGANHELFNEAPAYKNQALNLIAKYLRQDLQNQQDKKNM
jgi:alpha-beta hydrolase superfamily lysophospholipase